MKPSAKVVLCGVVLVFAALILLTICIQHVQQSNAEKDISICMYQDSVQQAHIQDSVRCTELRKQWEAEGRAYFMKDSLKYLSEPLITSKEVAGMKSVLNKWLRFYQININHFRLASQDSLNTALFLVPDDTLSLFYKPFDDKVQGKYTPQSRDYSPNRKRYINVLEASYVYQDDKDGKWCFAGSDDTQELRFVDVDRRIDKFLYQTGTSFVDAAFWKNNDCFIIVMYDRNDESYRMTMYDLQHQKRTTYRLKAPQSNKIYSEYNMKLRGIIIK